MIWFKPIDFRLNWGMNRVLGRILYLIFYWINHFELIKLLVKTY